MQTRGLLLLSLTAGPLACADPSLPTLNQVCYADEHCDQGEFCDKPDDRDEGICKVEGGESAAAATTSGSGQQGSEGTASTTDPIQSTDEDSGSQTDTGDSGDTGDTGDSDGAQDTGTTGGDTTGGFVGCAGIPRADVVDYGIAVTLPVGANAQGAAAADIDGDGALDLAVSSRDDGTLTIFMGDGFGNLSPAKIQPAGNFPTRVALGAIADATVDAVVVQDVDDTFYRIQGNGDGTFGNTSVVGATTASVQLVDVDGDDVLDLLGATTDGLTVSLGSAVGEGFGASVAYSTGFGGQHVATGDLDGNGSIDAVVAAGGGMVVLLGNGAGTFASQSPISAGGLVFGADVGDFDADGTLDIVVITAGGGNDAVRVWFGEGGGTLANNATISATQIGPSEVAAADIDQDGDADIIVGHGSGVLGITLSNGDGTFAPQQTFSCGSNTGQLAVGDFNDDCVLDVASPDSPNGEVCVWLSQ